MSYETENEWWYYFSKIIGSNNYDVEYANYLRIEGVIAEVAAEEARI